MSGLLSQYLLSEIEKAQKHLKFCSEIEVFPKRVIAVYKHEVAPRARGKHTLGPPLRDEEAFYMT